MGMEGGSMGMEGEQLSPVPSQQGGRNAHLDLVFPAGVQQQQRPSMFTPLDDPVPQHLLPRHPKGRAVDTSGALRQGAQILRAANVPDHRETRAVAGRVVLIVV